MPMGSRTRAFQSPDTPSRLKNRARPLRLSAFERVDRNDIVNPRNMA